jgi:hypothetical protein
MGELFAIPALLRTIIALPTSLNGSKEYLLPPRIVPFPRGFAFGHDGWLFLASGIGPRGDGDNAILAFTPSTFTGPSRLVADPELSPLDLAIAPNGNIVVSSEHPFGGMDAVTTVREYDPTDGHLVRVFSPRGKAEFRKPRGLRFATNEFSVKPGADAVLQWVARDGIGLKKGTFILLPAENGAINRGALEFKLVRPPENVPFVPIYM